MATPTMSPIAEAIAQQDGAIQRGEYSILGQLMLLHTARGRMEFFKNGPLIATLNDRLQLLLVSEWKGLPEKRVLLEEPCPACQVECEQCGGQGKSACQICGGSGLMDGLETCPCIAGGAPRPDPACQQGCFGLGMRRVTENCMNCEQGTAVCTVCKGTGERASGRRGDAPCAACQRLGRARAAGSSQCRCAECLVCQGHGRKVEMPPQPLEAFAHGRLEGMVALGPIHQVVWHTVDGSGQIRICDIRPDRDGNLMVLLLRGTKGNDPHAWLLGGLPVIRERRSA